MKKFLIIIASILFCCFLSIDIWYLAILLHAPQKVVSKTYEVGLQEIKKSDDESEEDTTKYFMEINSYDNLFEIKFNYMLDEQQTAFYSQGIQLFAPVGQKINFSRTYKNTIDGEKFFEQNAGLGRVTKTNYLLGDAEYKYINYNNYQSGDDYKTTTYSTNPIDNNTMFKIQIGNELYGMKFKGTDSSIKYQPEFYVTEKSHTDNFGFWINQYYDYYYRQCDIHYFVELVYRSIFRDGSTLKYGSNQVVTFEFGDLFNYYKCVNESAGIYEEDCIKDTSLIVKDVKSYYAIKINLHEGVAQSAKNSIFNCVNGSVYYANNNKVDNSEEAPKTTYFAGKAVRKLDIRDFELVNIGGNKRKLKLREDFVNFNKDYKSTMLLDVTIYLDYFDTLGLEFNGFDDSVFDFTFKNNSYKTLTEVDGQYVTKVVSL